MPPSSSSRRRRGGRGGRRGRNAPTKSVPADETETRNWAELPLDAISAILHKLDHVDILMGAGQVCLSWRGAARGEPELWRRINMLGHADLEHELNFPGMAQAAVRRSAGRCEAFWGEYAADHDFLLYLADQAPSLKSLRLISCYDVFDDGLTEAIMKFPLLEELELSLCPNVDDSGVFEVIGKACPQLKRFRLSKNVFFDYEAGDQEKDEEAMGIATMHELRSLQLFGNSLTNKGLTAILDNCRHLESLDIRHCFNVTMDDALRAKCARISTLRLPNDSTDDYDFIVKSPIWRNSESFLGDYVGSDSDYELGSDDYDDYCDPSRYLDGVYEDELNDEARMLLRGMRMLMK
ncbi:hypothetical protein CFC21_043355 [Triticum aestivum]|uniref:F-box domain-containing protein n=2 Tax=Triticum aestivum TaxID=4565 RepID=A0A9R1FPL3_WHEAT|nr:putative F-box/LRR-repeat protein 23 [Triticum aestivum]KAF7032146.1 hypothetical protein CFC21_043355 [Triticum aestivum]CDM85490.1 unnamed protein product [Triticum aestivum]